LMSMTIETSTAQRKSRSAMDFKRFCSTTRASVSQL
jgi:hypothetical protein